MEEVRRFRQFQVWTKESPNRRRIGYARFWILSLIQCKETDHRPVPFTSQDRRYHKLLVLAPDALSDLRFTDL